MIEKYSKSELKAELKRRQGLPAIAQWWNWRKKLPFDNTIWLSDLRKEWESSNFWTGTHTISLRGFLLTQGATLINKTVKGIDSTGKTVSRVCTEVKFT